MSSPPHQTPPEPPVTGISLLTPLSDRVQIRGLDRGDAGLLSAHLLRLPPEDRQSRFRGGMTDEAITGYVARIDWHGTYVFGAVVEGALRAVAELVGDTGGSSAEVAVSVEPMVQHLGLGRLLLLATILAARHIGFTHVRLSYHSQNRAMRALARDMGAATDRQGTDIDAVISVLRKQIDG